MSETVEIKTEAVECVVSSTVASITNQGPSTAHLRPTLTYTLCKPFESMAKDLDVIALCNRTHPIDKTTLNAALIEKRIDEGAQNQFKCFLNCLYVNYEWMDHNGVLQYINIKHMLSETSLDSKTIKYLLDKCINAGQGVDACEKAYLFTKCFWLETAEQVSNSSEGNRQILPYNDYDDYS